MRQRHEIVGREAELSRLTELFETSGPGCILIDGEAGIGKTTLWLHAVGETPPQWHALLARPAESEATLPFAALGDLLEPLLDTDESGPSPQHGVLDAALQRTQAKRPHRLAVSRAALTLLRRAAEESPLLLAIDDTQWLDGPSREVLEFVVRRISEAPIRLLLARRSEEELPPPLGLDRATLQGGIAHIRVGPLTADEVGGILRAELGLRLSRPRLAELHVASGGNPFYAIEIGRALVDGDSIDKGESLPVPDRGALLRRRLDALSASARLAALLTSAAVQPTTTLIERAAGAVDGMAEAMREGVLLVAGERLRFAHPLLASAAYAGAPPWERRDAHTRLARVADDPLERANHLARCTGDPDEAVAAELVEAAAQAAARAAPESAARLLERAAELTPAADDASRRQRLLDAVPHHLAAGDPHRGRLIVEELIADLPPGPERADLLCRSADLGYGPADAERIVRQALAEAGDDPAVGARAQILLATFTSLTGDRPAAAEHARTAAALAERAGDARLVALTVGDLCYRLMILGLPYPEEDLERALELERSLPEGALLAHQRPSFQLGIILGYTDRPDEARPLLRAELDRLARAGDESWQIGALFRLADIELRAGNWAEARRLSRRCVAMAASGGIAQEETVALVIDAAVEAHLGHVDAADGSARAALRLAEEGGDRSYGVRALAVLGFLALSRGDPDEALAYLCPAGAQLREVGMGELSIQQVVHNEVEALVAVGRLEDAEDVVAYIEEKGRPTRRSWHEAMTARGRALVASARGDAGEARRQIELSLAAHERLPQPFELGRTLLAQGTIERRAKRRADARAALTRALELFDQLGAPLWAERAAQELARIPGRAPAGRELSETERRIAELVAAGHANKEIADRLFVTVRTVEGNLTRIYDKLGLRSRTELAAELARERAQ